MRHHFRSAVATGAAALLLVSGTGTAAAQGSLEFALPFGLAIPGLSSLAPAGAQPGGAAAADPATADLLPEEVRLMAFEGSVVAAVNDARLVVGADRLVTDPVLEASARERAAELAAGDPATGDVPVPADARAGEDADSEEVPAGEESGDRTVLTLPAGATPQKTLSALLTDTGMRERMLDGEFTRVGVGVVTAEDGTVHVVQDFARD
ncbi:MULTISPECIES: CAP domain-containing protein [Dietzia]|uniref:CAP domain-containing protein n=1 Tax=Dietzia TaxID=37914 RepID=UPI000D093027|nr:MULTISPECIES: CAP domain-containing protein [Dietzia]PWD96760.1 CAP domain-containing protein [Dietzia maris]AVM64403.1 CAP domain-containing protein [Dietzia sp. oral taxon 368]MBM7230108.1 CAP domain-containing protein [Dietzia cinnamea]MCT1640423.1 CAP domain-containing protein [Dietzia cinnamea]MCT1710973.1 CAP domain-containing protein [Dietzia cinnamea]